MIDGDLFDGFSKLNLKQRLQRLQDMGALSAEDMKTLQQEQQAPISLAEKLIENVIGYFHLPLGVAANLRIDGEDCAVPMAVEETSIIAAISKTAKWIRKFGRIQTSIQGHATIGQIQIARVNDYERLVTQIQNNKDYLIEQANETVLPQMVERGGGMQDITVRQVARGDGTHMAVIHVTVDTCDAMGANVVNQVCEFLKQPIEALTGEVVTMCILSNLSDSKLIQAEVVIENIEPLLATSIAEASLFAEQDPYRAATNNKGVLNGMDPVLIATGNDWRAVEAGVHAYAARSGQYRSITTWRADGSTLTGKLIAPIAVGTVGGVTTLHPMAQLCMRILNVASADRLAQIVAAVGLVQNLGAIRALVTEGIIKGHMKLHIDNLALGAGAEEQELPALRQKLREILTLHKRITLQNAVDVLKELRTTPSTVEIEVTPREI